jgi:hypothetical protein
MFNFNIKKMESTPMIYHPVKELIKNYLLKNLKNFELVNGGQQRTIGDLIENEVANLMLNINDELISKTIESSGKKSIEDVTIFSKNVKYYLDTKTRNIDAKFSMPNLTAIEKIKDLIENENEELIYIIVSYDIESNIVKIKDVKVSFVWEFDVKMLRIGNLGRGQLQIKNAKESLIFTDKGKKEWFSDVKILAQDFFKKQIIKLNKQIIKWQ